MFVSLKGKHALLSSKVWKQVQERAQRYKNDHNYPSPQVVKFRLGNIETSSSQYIMNVYQYSHYKNLCNIYKYKFCLLKNSKITYQFVSFCRKVTYMVLAIYYHEVDITVQL